MQIGTASIGSVPEKRLIVAGLAVSYTRAEEQDLRQAVDFAVDRGGKCARREGQIRTASKAGEERGVINAPGALTEDASRQAVVVGVVHGGGADLTIDIPGIDERRALHGVNEAIAGFVLKRVERLKVTNSQQQRIVPDLEALILEISVLHSGEVVREVDFEDILPVIPENALNAEASTPKLGGAHIREGRDRRILVDVVVVHLETPADLHLELAVCTRKFRRALPFDLQIEIAAAGTCRRRVRRGGLSFSVGHLLLQCLDGCLHLLDLRLDLLQICLRLRLCIRRNYENSDNARACEQIAADLLESPCHAPLHCRKLCGHALRKSGNTSVPSCSCLKSLLIRPVPLYFRPNDGLVTLQRQLVFWINLLLIGNGRPGELIRSCPRTLHDIASIVVLLCFSDACGDLFHWVIGTGTTEDETSPRPANCMTSPWSGLALRGLLPRLRSRTWAPMPLRLDRPPRRRATVRSTRGPLRFSQVPSIF